VPIGQGCPAPGAWWCCTCNCQTGPAPSRGRSRPGPHRPPSWTNTHPSGRGASNTACRQRGRAATGLHRCNTRGVGPGKGVHSPGSTSSGPRPRAPLPECHAQVAGQLAVIRAADPPRRSPPEPPGSGASRRACQTRSSPPRRPRSQSTPSGGNSQIGQQLNSHLRWSSGRAIGVLQPEARRPRPNSGARPDKGGAGVSADQTPDAAGRESAEGPPPPPRRQPLSSGGEPFRKPTAVGRFPTGSPQRFGAPPRTAPARIR